MILNLAQDALTVTIDRHNLLLSKKSTPMDRIHGYLY
jgi:hypothetical protein